MGAADNHRIGGKVGNTELEVLPFYYYQKRVTLSIIHAMQLHFDSV